MNNRVCHFLVVGIVCIAAVLLPAACAQNVQTVTVKNGENSTTILIPGLIEEVTPASNIRLEMSEVVSEDSIQSSGRSSLRSASSPRSGIEWQRVYGARYAEEFASIHPTDDGGYTACGLTDAYYPDGDVNPPQFYGNGDAWVMKINPDGSPDWQYVYGGQGRNFRFNRPVRQRCIEFYQCRIQDEFLS